MPRDSTSVLLVDDSTYWTDLISGWLRGRGYAVTVKHDGLAAVEELRDRPPSVLITDFFLATLDGGKLCQLAKRLQTEPKVATVILTGGADRRLTKTPSPHADAIVAKNAPDVVFTDLEQVLDRLEQSPSGGDTELVGLERLESRSVAQKLHGLKEYLDALHEGIGDAVLQVDAELRLLFVNATAAELFGVSVQDALARPLVQVLEIPEDHKLVRRIREALAEGSRKKRPITVEVRESALRVTVAPLKSPDGRATALIIAQDISDLKAAEQARVSLHARLHEADKMASLGHMVAGVCHEINNPLAAVMLNLDSMKAILRGLSHDGDPGALAADLDQVLNETADAAGRVHAVVQDMRSFSHMGEPKGQLVRIEDLADAALSFVASEARHRARIEKDLQPTKRIIADRTRLSQALLNILINAAQAIQGHSPEQHYIRVTTRPASGGVSVEIENSGPPIPEEIKQKIFDPFFTTKQAGDGVGLGLSIAYETIRRHGGFIDVASEPGLPTTFRIWLPEDTGMAISAAPERPAPTPPSAASILIVDDDHLLRRSLKRSLEKHFDVDVASGGARASELMAEKQFDVVLCDLIMPEMTGMEFFELARTRWPEVTDRFVFLTGGTNTPEAREFLRSVDNPRAFKPVQPDELVRLVHDCLQSRGSSPPQGQRTI